MGHTVDTARVGFLEALLGETTHPFTAVQTVEAAHEALDGYVGRAAKLQECAAVLSGAEGRVAKSKARWFARRVTEIGRGLEELRLAQTMFGASSTRSFHAANSFNESVRLFMDALQQLGAGQADFFRAEILASRIAIVIVVGAAIASGLIIRNCRNKGKSQS